MEHRKNFMKKKIKIIFIGSVVFSKHLLITLKNLDFIEIVAVVTKKRKKMKSDFCDLSHTSNKYKIRSLIVNDINSKKSYNILRNLEFDYIFCFGWSQILKKKIIKLAKKFAIGYHPSDLPSNRGRHPIIWAISLGLKNTASCFFKINEKADDGKILSKKYIKILNKDDANSLYLKLVNSAKYQLKQLTYDLYNNKVKVIKELKKEKNYWRKRNYEDGKIDWRMNANSIYNLIKSLSTPYDGAHFIFKDREFKVFDSKVIKIDKDNIEPGKILRVSLNNFIVKCGIDALQLIMIKSNKVFKKGEYLK